MCVGPSSYTCAQAPQDGEAVVEPGPVEAEQPAERATFYTQGRDLLDRHGHKVVLRGVNKMSIYEPIDPTGSVYLPEIRSTGANSIRIVWKIHDDAGAETSLDLLDTLISGAHAQQLVPMVELHDANDFADLPLLVAYWTRADVVALIAKHQAYLLVNIGNEVGDDTVDGAAFVAGYTDAVRQLRVAGVHTPLVIDAPDWGKDLAVLNDTAAALLAADPDGNLIFSVHLYWSKSCGADATYIRSQLRQAALLGYPLVVGEFSQFGGFPCSDPGASICSPAAEVDYPAVLAACDEFRIGWYAWEWGPGNAFFDPLCAVMDMTPDRMFSNLQPGWAREIAVTSPFGIQQTSVTPVWI
jgi:mannan endo-1,4-beta-mannosidase